MGIAEKNCKSYNTYIYDRPIGGVIRKGYNRIAKKTSENNETMLGKCKMEFLEA